MLAIRDQTPIPGRRSGSLGTLLCHFATVPLARLSKCCRPGSLQFRRGVEMDYDATQPRDLILVDGLNSSLQTLG
jgi:hypothetical protein